MAVWKLKRVGAVSSATGEPFGPDVEIVTALFGEAEEEGEESVRGSGFIRKDFLADEATEEILAGAYCTWHTRTPAEKPKTERRFDLGMAREFLDRLLRENRPDRAAVCLTLALLLARKRRLVILEQGVDQLKVRWPREKETFLVPAPDVSDADAEILQQDLMRLFDLQQGDGDPAQAQASAEPPEEDAATADAAPAEPSPEAPPTDQAG